MRFIPKDPRALIADGWCVKTPRLLPAVCSWCNVQFAHQNGALVCRVCDAPPRTGVLRVVDIEKEAGDPNE